jgi:hypothetical protein
VRSGVFAFTVLWLSKPIPALDDKPIDRIAPKTIIEQSRA